MAVIWKLSCEFSPIFFFFFVTVKKKVRNFSDNILFQYIWDAEYEFEIKIAPYRISFGDSVVIIAILSMSYIRGGVETPDEK